MVVVLLGYPDTSLSRCVFLFLLTGFLAACGARSVEQTGSPADYLSVPEGFTVEQVAGTDLVDYPTFATFDSEGRLFVIESTRANTMSTEEMREDPHHRIKILEDVDGDGVYDSSKVFADELPFPEGGVWHEGSFYVAAAPDLLRFEDTDGDDVADTREVVLSGWTLYVNGALLSGPFVGPDGWLYMADARRGFDIITKEGEKLEGAGARIWRLQPDGRRLESMSGGGFDNSIEIVFTPAGETIGTMTYFVDPRAGQRDALMHWVEGGVYPKHHSVIEEDDLTRTGELMPVMSKLARIAHSGLYRYDHPHFGEAYRGNLFSAQFNTGRIMRHRVSRVEATFETTESKFLTSSNADFHPTDVLADGDGSLLVVDTGGWFIKGCPLSQVAKPDVPGGIYRIRRTGGAEVEDPWGRSIEWKSRPTSELVGYLTDERPKVRDRAIEQLVAAGVEAVGPLRNVLRGSPSSEARASAVFALYRIGSVEARAGVRRGLTDESSQVRNAAARSVGLARDGAAVKRLVEMVRSDEAPVRRQAATALGQIGDPRAVPALLAASADPDDRFVEHAVIYALIQLNRSDPLLKALDHADADVRRAALVALDQMEESPLTRQHVASFLTSSDPELRQTGIWVVSHHPEWSAVVRDFLRGRLHDQELSEQEEQSVAEVLVSFCGDTGVQQLIADLLAEPSVSSDRKELLLEAIDRCSVEEVPDRWEHQIGRLLDAGRGTLRAKALALVESRGIESLTPELEEIIRKEEEEMPVRLQALGALVLIRPELSSEYFNLLVGQLDSDIDAPVRQSAAGILARADLSTRQLMQLADEYVITVDPFILSRLLEAFSADSSRRVGYALVDALRQSPERLDNISEQNLQELLTGYPESVQAAAQPLMEMLRQQQEGRLKRLQEVGGQLTEGDVGAGREIFFGDKVICSSCHAVGGEGGDFGPDLTNIGEIRSRHDLLEAIMYPSVSFAREYETYQVTTSAATHRGVIMEQTPEMVLLQTGPDAQMRIPRRDIVSMQQGTTSMMPQGLDQVLSDAELSDLMAFLEALPGAAVWESEGAD